MNKALYELVEESVTLDGRKFEIPAMIVYDVSDDKIQQYRSLYDRLSIAKQAAKGWLEKKTVNSIVNRMEKGLH